MCKENKTSAICMPNTLKLLLYGKQHIIMETAKYGIHNPLILQLLLLLLLLDKLSFHFSDKKCVTTFNPQTLDFDVTNQCMLGIKFSI